METCRLISSQRPAAIERKPSKEFEGWIEKFWCPAHSLENVQEIFEILPDGNFDLLFAMKDSRCKVVFAGPYTQRTYVPKDDALDYFGIRFRPGKMPRVADVNPANLVNTLITPSHLLGIDIDDLGERLHALKGIDARQAFIENVFRQYGKETVMREGIGSRCAEVVESCRGQIKVSDLAETAGVSKRTLERVFQTEVGISPKTFIRCVRFQDALKKIDSGRYVSLAEIAYDCGYTDQSHFIKDYKQLSGRLPGCP